MTSRKATNSIATVLILAVAIALSACGSSSSSGPSADEAQKALRDFDQTAVAGHNAVTPKFDRTLACWRGASLPTVGGCLGPAKAYVAVLNREQRKLVAAYKKAPAYVQRVYGPFYRAESKANKADRQYAAAVLAFTQAARKVDTAAAGRALKRLQAATRLTDRLDSASIRALSRARVRAKKYVDGL